MFGGSSIPEQRTSLLGTIVQPSHGLPFPGSGVQGRIQLGGSVCSELGCSKGGTLQSSSLGQCVGPMMLIETQDTFNISLFLLFHVHCSCI